MARYGVKTKKIGFLKWEATVKFGVTEYHFEAITERRANLKAINWIDTTLAEIKKANP